MQHISNIVIVKPKVLNNNVIVNDKEARVDRIADRLIEKLNNESGRLFYCKVGWSLSEAQIENNLEIALKGKDPKRYFTWLCMKDMGKK